MLAKIDTPLWRRDPSILSDQDWGLVYAGHGAASLLLIFFVIVHIYFAFLPEHRRLLAAMVFGRAMPAPATRPRAEAAGMSDPDGIRAHIEAIEEAYEFMLAYAAQGRAEEGAGPDGAHIRTFLAQFDAAVTAIAQEIDSLPGAGGEAAAFLRGFEADSRTMTSVLQMMLARNQITSEVVDNANGLISVRSYLTSIFFLDKAVLS